MAEVGVLGMRSLFTAAPAHVGLRPEADSSASNGQVVESSAKAPDAKEQRGARADVPEERESVEKVAKKIREQIHASPMDLKIVVDDGYYVFELVDAKTGDVIRRIPPNWFKTDAHYSNRPQGDERVPTGVLVDQNG